MAKKNVTKDKEPDNSDIITNNKNGFQLSPKSIIAFITFQMTLIGGAFTCGRYYEETQQKEKIVEIKEDFLRQNKNSQMEILNLKEECITYKQEILNVKSLKEENGNGKKSK